MKYRTGGVITLAVVAFSVLFSAPAFAFNQIHSEYSFICGGGHEDMSDQSSTDLSGQNN